MTEATLPDGDRASPTAVLVHPTTELQESLDGPAENLARVETVAVSLSRNILGPP